MRKRDWVLMPQGTLDFVAAELKRWEHLIKTTIDEDLHRHKRVHNSKCLEIGKGELTQVQDPKIEESHRARSNEPVTRFIAVCRGNLRGQSGGCLVEDRVLCGSREQLEGCHARGAVHSLKGEVMAPRMLRKDWQHALDAAR